MFFHKVYKQKVNTNFKTLVKQNVSVISQITLYQDLIYEKDLYPQLLQAIGNLRNFNFAI